MLKVGAATVAVIVLGLFFLHGRHSSKAASVNACLKKTGATVTQSTFFEDIFASSAAQDGETLPEPMRNVARELDKHLYDANYGGSSALLIFTNGGRQADTVELQLAQLSQFSDLGPSKRVGNVLVLWTDVPSDGASAAVYGCLE